MEILGSTKNKITNDKNGGNVPHFEIVNNDYQQDSIVLYMYICSK